MHTMGRSEPSLVPQWLRSNGGGSSTHQFSSSQAEGPVFALPISRSLKSVSNSDSLHSPLLDRTSSSNSRSTISNGFNKHDKDSYARSYSSFSRSHRDRDRERSTARSRDSEYCDPLKGVINGRAEDSLRRSPSLISSRQGDHSHQRVPADTRNGIHKPHDNGTHSVGGNGTGIHKVSFERDFPVLRSEERPKTPDLIRVSSPGLSRGIQSSSISNPPLVGSETWTSALADVPMASASNSSFSPVSSSNSSGLNMAEALVQASVQSHNAPQPSIQLQKEELALAQSKKLIPVTPLLTKTTVLSASDKLKPKTKTAMRPSETAITPKNGVQHPQPLLVGSQPVRGDDPKSPSGKLLLLKPGRENGVSPVLKDLQIPTTNANNRVANCHSTNSPTASGPSKNSHKPKILHGAVIDKRTSRSNFFKLMREKSLNNTPGPIGSEASASLDIVDKLDEEAKDLACAETENELKCNGETCTVVTNLSSSVMINHEEEKAFLLSLGWEDKVEDGEEGLTKEEIDAFCKKVIEQGATSRLCRLLQAKLISNVGCSSNELNTPVSQTEA